jgi:hypothetical protein
MPDDSTLVNCTSTGRRALRAETNANTDTDGYDQRGRPLLVIGAKVLGVIAFMVGPMIAMRSEWHLFLYALNRAFLSALP